MPGRSAFGFAPMSFPRHQNFSRVPPTVPWVARWQARQTGTRFMLIRSPPAPTGISSCGSTAHCWQTGLMSQATHRPLCRSMTLVSRSTPATLSAARRRRARRRFGVSPVFGWAKPDQSIAITNAAVPFSAGSLGRPPLRLSRAQRSGSAAAGLRRSSPARPG